MRRIQFISCLVAVVSAVGVGQRQNVDSPYEVGTWQGFRSAAVSFTFDDGCANQFAVALPMFNAYGFKMTLFTVVNWSPNWTALQTAASQGHEIASHTMTHANLSALSSADQIAELRNSRDAIDSHITGQRCLTVAYPYCVPDTCGASARFYLAARGCSGSIEPSTPANFMNISSLVCGNLSSIQTPQDFSAKAVAAAASNGWVVFLLHGIDDDGGYSPVLSSNLRGALDSMKVHSDLYWVATFGTVARYIKERNAVTVRELSLTDSSIALRATDTLENAVFNVPLTLRRPLPPTWEAVSITQNGRSRDARLIEAGGLKSVMFDVVPDSGDIVITRTQATHATGSLDMLPERPRLEQNFPNPFNPRTVVNCQWSETSVVRLDVYDVLGREVAVLADGSYLAGKYSFAFDGSNLASGVYLYRLAAGAYTGVRRMILAR